MRRIFVGLLLAILTLAAIPALAEEGGGDNGPVYVRLKPISFSVIGPTNKITREVSILLVLELNDGKTELMLDPYKRQILDSFLLILNEAYDETPNDSSRVDLADLKASLLKSATDITGPGIIRSVLIAGVGERAH